MNLNNISLPYPVLGINDDILPLLPEDCLTPNVTETQGRKAYVFNIDLKFENDDIAELIKQGKAEYSCEYDCARTMIRSCERSSEPHFEITLPRKNVYGRINFKCYVSVKTRINGYTNRGFNEDYAGAEFDMEPGDILVAFPEFRYDVDIRYDKLQAAGSFMQIRESETHDDVYFDISGDKIEILLPPRHYQLYTKNAVRGSAQIIHSSLVMNALTYALMRIDEYEHTTWAKTIIYRMETEDGYNVEDLEDFNKILSIAQKLLRDPYLRLFNHLIENSTSN